MNFYLLPHLPICYYETWYFSLPQTAQDQQENTTASAPSEFNIQTFNTGKQSYSYKKTIKNKHCFVGPNNISIRGGPLVIVAFGPNSQTCTCPYCSHLVSTSVKSRATMKTHVMACVLCSIM